MWEYLKRRDDILSADLAGTFAAEHGVVVGVVSDDHDGAQPGRILCVVAPIESA
jgi:hypothetical protein